MPSSLGPAEILVILVVALIVLGPNKLPQAGRQVGRALAEIRKWTTDVKSEVRTAFDVESALAERPADKAPSYDDYSSYQPLPEATTEPQPPKRVDLTKPARAAAPATPATPAIDTPSQPAVDDRL